MADRSFVVDWNKSSDSAYITVLDEPKLWHKRLGHANYKSLVLMTKASIKHQLTNTYTPQQNGVSERKNISLMDLARCLLFEKNLPKTLWAKAVNTTVYFQNRLPTKALVQKTPFEVWFEFKPSLAHLRVFGWTCYAHVPAVKRDKLAKKAQPGILVGYSSVKKCYMILDPSSNKDKNEPEYVTEDLVTDQIEVVQDEPELDIDVEPVRGSKPLSEIYEKVEVAAIEPSCFEEAEAQQGKVIRVKWVFRAKHNVDGSLNKLKARLVVKRFSQKYGIDYFETFTLVARLDTIRQLVPLASQKQWKIHQLDVKSAFLNGFLEEKIYVEQLEGFKVASKEDSVYKLKKALSISKPTLYVKKEGDETQLIVSLNVDDLLVTRGNHAILADFKGKMEQMFEMSDLGQMSYFLGMEVSQTQQGIFLSQKAFSLKILNKFSMLNCKATSTIVAIREKLSNQGDFEKVCESTYRSLIGCLFYLTATRPNIMFVVSPLSRFMHCCNEKHFQAAKRVFRYIKGTLSFGMTFTKSSKKQNVVAQSTAEVEYVVAAGAVNQAIWLRKIMVDLNLHQREATEIKCDNRSTVAIAKNPVFYRRTKHFKMKFYFVREMEQDQERQRRLKLELQLQRQEALDRKKDKGKKEATKRKFPPCAHCKKTNHLEKYCWHKPDIQCRGCKQLGHIEKVCKNKPKPQLHHQNQAQTAEDVEAQEEHVFTASCFASSSKVSKMWLIDSGCTHHMASNRSMFKELDTIFVTKVRIGNGELIEVKGKGKAVIGTKSGNKTISKVLYVPDIDQNLLSVGQLLEKGYSFIFEGKVCVIKDAVDQALVTVVMSDRSFTLDVNQLEPKTHVAQADKSSLWHRRLGHVNYKSLGLLHKMSLVEDMFCIEPKKDVCEVCQLGKQTRLPFSANKAWRAQERL
ncbi:hypothetical protein CXB51_016920 [Gossypium anomalum]|uniref:Integrase catalytic domain-containing protein n=1 Tax=Gossypium anomalum TaxID=47600 RepID=A0A8J5YX18_9ROSI|nr:hypothetical protein CXB51_016920 [Gossypium anomalum]